MAALTAVLCIPAVAQEAPGERTRSVEGAVRDEAGQLVTGAVVELKNTRTLNIRSYVTSKDGKYHFNGLFSNIDYEIKAQYHGAFGPARQISQFAKEKVTMDLRVPGKLNE